MPLQGWRQAKPCSGLACNTVSSQSPAVLSVPAPLLFILADPWVQTHTHLGRGMPACVPEGLQSPAWFAAGEPGSPESVSAKVNYVPLEEKTSHP